MIDKRTLLKEIESLPPHVVEEVYKYIAFIKFKDKQEKKINGITLASEKALAKDWLTPEEDSVWANL
jgi:hypothetical protein